MNRISANSTDPPLAFPAHAGTNRSFTPWNRSLTSPRQGRTVEQRETPPPQFLSGGVSLSYTAGDPAM